MSRCTLVRTGLILLPVLLAAPIRLHAQSAALAPEAGLVTIVFHEGATSATVSAFEATLDAEVVYRFRTIPALLVRAGSRAPEVASLSRAHPAIRLVEEERSVPTGAIPDDPLYPDQYYHHNERQQFCSGLGWGQYFADIDSERAWDHHTGSSSVVVAIVDTGVDIAHPDLADNIFVNTAEIPNGVDDDGNGLIDDIHGWDFVGGDDDPSHPVGDTGFHGTRVAGAVGARGNNGIGPAGPSWDVSILPLRTGSNNGIDVGAAAAAIDYAVAQGAHIINNSWGSTSPLPSIELVIEAASEAGVLVVNIAHNQAAFQCGGLNNDVCPIYPANYDYPLNLSVAASTQEDLLWSGSRFGPTTVHLAAPGVGIRTTSGLNDTAPYGCWSGTSLAAPIVCGSAALVKAYFDTPGNPLTGLQLRDKLLDNAERIPELAGYLQEGRRLNTYRSITPTDPSPPAAITDLAAVAHGSSVTLTWTASGDDGASGAVMANVLYRSTQPIDGSNYKSLNHTFVLDCPPVTGGTQQSCVIEGLSYSTTYHFVVKPFDDWRNTPGISNDAAVTTDAPPTIAFSPSVVVSYLDTGDTDTQPFWILNTGGSDLTFDITNDAPWVDVSPLQGTVPPGDSLEITCVFDASGQCDLLVEQLDITSNDPAAWQGSTYYLFGVVTPGPADLAVSPEPLDFGNVPLFSIATKYLSVMNHGCEDLVVGSLAISGTGFSLGSTNGFTVAPGGLRKVKVSFNASQPGAHNGTLTVNSDDPDDPVHNVALSAFVLGPDAPGVGPRELSLSNVPNPFRGGTRFQFTLVSPGQVDIRVYDVRGRMVRKLDAGHRSAGVHEIAWPGRDETGRQVAAGLYFYRLLLDGTPTGDIRRAVVLD